MRPTTLAHLGASSWPVVTPVSPQAGLAVVVVDAVASAASDATAMLHAAAAALSSGRGPSAKSTLVQLAADQLV